MKKFSIVLVVVATMLTSNSFAEVVGLLDGVSIQSTFGLGTGYHEAAPAGWTLVYSPDSSNFISSYGDANPPTNNAALCTYNWPPFGQCGDYTCTAQFATSTPVVANQQYQLDLLAGSFVNWENGYATYQVIFGTVNGGVFTPFATSAAQKIHVTGADFLCNGQGQAVISQAIDSSVRGDMAIQM